MHPSITVLMPVYNGMLYLQQQVDSVLADDKVTGLIICDDASTDDTPTFLKTLEANSRVRLFRNTTNIGVIRTVERLLQLVETEYFALADQDDLWIPDRLASYAPLLQQNRTILIYSDLTVVSEDLQVLHSSRWRVSNQKPLRGDAVESLIVKSPVNGCTVIASSDLLRLALPFPGRIPMHDTWLAAVAAASGKLEYISAPTVLYRQHSRNESGGASAYSLRGLVERVRKHARGNIFRYTRMRFEHRLALIDGLASRGLERKSLKYMRAYYSAGTLARITGLPLYLALLIRYCRALGLRNILTDTVMSAIPTFNQRPSS